MCIFWKHTIGTDDTCLQKNTTLVYKMKWEEKKIANWIYFFLVYLKGHKIFFYGHMACPLVGIMSEIICM